MNIRFGRSPSSIPFAADTVGRSERVPRPSESPVEGALACVFGVERDGEVVTAHQKLAALREQAANVERALVCDAPGRRVADAGLFTRTYAKVGAPLVDQCNFGALALVVASLGGAIAAQHVAGQVGAMAFIAVAIPGIALGWRPLADRLALRRTDRHMQSALQAERTTLAAGIAQAEADLAEARMRATARLSSVPGAVAGTVTLEPDHVSIGGVTVPRRTV